MLRQAQIAKYLNLLYEDAFQDWQKKRHDQLLDIARHALALQQFRAERMPPGATSLETFADFRDWKANHPDEAESYLRQFDEAEALKFLKDPRTSKEVRNLAFAHFTPEEFPTHRMLQELMMLDPMGAERDQIMEIATLTPVLALNLEDRATTEIVQPAPLVTPTHLLALLDKAKAFPLLKKQHPEAVADAEARPFGDKPQVTDFDDYEVRIEEVFRFNSADTLVFHVTLRNKSDWEIRYLPESFCVRIGNRLYYQAISDAPGLLPPHTASTVYFAITGTPDGGRNEVSLKNEFSVLVSRLPSPPTSAATTESTQTPAPSPSPPTTMTLQQESLARQALRRAIEESQNAAGASAQSPSNAPSAKQTNP